MKKAVFFFTLTPLFGAVSGLVVNGVTPQQAVIQFSVADPTMCTVTAYKDPAFTTLMDDTSNSLFAGSQACNRPTSIVTGRQVQAVIFKRSAEMALDGLRHSRSGAVTQSYYIQVKDLTDNTSASVTVVLPNIPFGSTAPEAPLFDANAFGRWGYPDLDWSDAGNTKEYIDPVGGLQFRRIPRQVYGRGGRWGDTPFEEMTFAGAFDTAFEQTGKAAWMNVQNALNTTTSGPFASYSGSTQSSLFLAFARQSYSPPFNVQESLDDVQAHIYGYAPGCTGLDCHIYVCLAVAYNPQTDSCASELDVTLPTSVAEVSAPSSYPSWQFAGWKVGRYLNNSESTIYGTVYSNGAAPGTANIASSTVTLTAHSNDDTLLPPWAQSGMKLQVNGNWYTINNLNTAKTFSIREAAVTNAGAWQMGAFGIRIRKATTNTNPIYVAGTYSIATAVLPQVSAGSEGRWCNDNTFTLAVAADGVTPIAPKQARLCMTGEKEQYMILLAADGEMRYISPLRPPGGLYIPPTSFSPTDPYTIYASGADNSDARYQALYSLVYTPSLGCNYSSWAGNSYWTTNPKGGPADCMVLTNLTPHNQGRSVTEQLQTALTNNPVWDPTFSALSFCRNQTPGALPASCFVFRTVMTHYALFSLGGQDGICFEAIFDLSTASMVKVFDSYSGSMSGLRWGSCHSDGNNDLAKWYNVVVKLMWGGGFPYLAGPWTLGAGGVSQKSLDGVSYTTDVSLTSLAAGTCAPNPAGVTGPQCVWWHVNTDQPCDGNSSNSFSTANTRWPCPWQNGWTAGTLKAQVGDYVSRYCPLCGVALDGKFEKQRILTKTSDGAGGWYLMMQRWAACDNPTSDFNGAPPAVQYFDHVRNAPLATWGAVGTWQMYMTPPQACDMLDAWYDATLPLSQSAIAPFTYLTNSHGMMGGSPTGNQHTQLGPGIFRTGPMPQIINQPDDHTANISDIPWAGIHKGDSSGVLEQYAQNVNFTVANTYNKGLYFDYRHFNPGAGYIPEIVGINLYKHNYQLAGGTQFVYKVNLFKDIHDQKLWRPYTASTNGIWQDISGPGSVIDDTSTWAACYAYKAGECRPNSLAGDYFVWAKNAHIEAGACIVGTLKIYSPCSMALWPNGAWVVQGDTQQNDPVGTIWRKLTMGLVGPYSTYMYSTPHTVSDYSWMFVRSSWPNGVSTAPLLYKIPPPPVADGVDRTVPIPVVLVAPPGSGYLRVRFGYAENGPTLFHCTSRNEDCLTDGAIQPFAYAQSDTLTPKSCVNGCTVSVPGISGRILYFQVEQSPDKITWVARGNGVRAIN